MHRWYEFGDGAEAAPLPKHQTRTTANPSTATWYAMTEALYWGVVRRGLHHWPKRGGVRAKVAPQGHSGRVQARPNPHHPPWFAPTVQPVCLKALSPCSVGKDEAPSAASGRQVEWWEALLPPSHAPSLPPIDGPQWRMGDTRAPLAWSRGNRARGDVAAGIAGKPSIPPLARGGALPPATLLPPRTPAHSATTATQGRSPGQRGAGWGLLRAARAPRSVSCGHSARLRSPGRARNSPPTPPLSTWDQASTNQHQSGVTGPTLATIGVLSARAQ